MGMTIDNALRLEREVTCPTALNAGDTTSRAEGEVGGAAGEFESDESNEGLFICLRRMISEIARGGDSSESECGGAAEDDFDWRGGVCRFGGRR